jgi:hypothetical protein
MIKFGKAKIQQAGELKEFLSGEGDILKRKIAKYASEGVGIFKQIQLDPYRYLYVRNRAISAEEYFGPNDNGDAFPEAELRKSYATFIGKPVTIDHKGILKIGVVLDSTYIEPVDPTNPMTGNFVMNIWAIDKDLAEKTRPGLIDHILSGKVVDTSMGVSVEYSECSACGHIAHTEDEYCSHIRHYKMSTIKVGSRYVQVYERCFGLNFFEDSLIIPLELGGLAGGRGADRFAEIKEIFTIPTPSYKLSTVQKRAEDYKPNIDKYVRDQKHDDVKGPQDFMKEKPKDDKNIQTQEGEGKRYELPEPNNEEYVKERYHAIEDLGKEMSTLKVDEVPNLFSALSAEEQSELQKNLMQLFSSAKAVLAAICPRRKRGAAPWDVQDFDEGVDMEPGVGQEFDEGNCGPYDVSLEYYFDKLVDMIYKHNIPFGIAIQSIYDEYTSGTTFKPIDKAYDLEEDLGFESMEISEDAYSDIYTPKMLPPVETEDFSINDLYEDIEIDYL